MAFTRCPTDRSVPARLLLARVLFAAGLLTAAVAGGCGQDAPEGVIDREVFIQAYIDLRVAALEAEDQQMTEETRTEVLERHGIEAEDLLDFAEVHARDLEFMRDVWNDIELRMDALRPEGPGR